ncbi:hypothetical protein SAMN03159343_3885 [Klenkia marina]|uniref:Uncharacterized protein n=1 Tax=Klenkia marina TaxID=1960309 RepID=A0A1G4Z0G9_9ACTN|nr:hypothetical protein [Klenkia marina]SCX59055.1 hypothetical protein SAMN03159343_3885 [Klenkia marina]
MQSGRIGRTARRGVAVLTLGWLLAMAGSVLAAPTASAAPTATVEIRTLTPPVVSIDAGGTATFVNSVASYPASITLPLVGTLGATVYTDIAVSFNGSTQTLQPGQSASYTFPGSTVGSITYTYRVVSGTNLSAAVLNQLVNGIVGTLPPLPVGTPFVVNTLVPLPNLPSANLPTLPPVNVAVPTTPGTAPTAPPVTGTDPGTAPVAEQPATEAPAAGDGTGYQYSLPGSGGGQLAPVDTSAAAAFDPSRFTTSDAASSARSGGGGGPGSYDGASVPVFGQLAGLNGSSLPSGGDDVEIASDTSSRPDPALSVPALAAVVALAGVTAALVRTHLAQRAAKR